MKRLTILLTLLISLIFTPNNTNAQENQDYEEISESLYLVKNISGGNVVFLVTRKGVIVVDAGGTPSSGEKIISIINSVTNKPIKYLILTHFHSDHINGISAFPADVTIIAHKDLAQHNETYNKVKLNNYINNVLPSYLVDLKLQMGEIEDKKSDKYLKLQDDYDSNEKYLEDIKKVKFRDPDITVEDFYGFKLADERIMLEFTGPGHTADNIVVKFSNHNVIHTGDLVFNGKVPYLIDDHGVDVQNWIQTLDDLYEENIYTVVPGHGDIGDKILLKEQSDYFITLTKKIAGLKNAGNSLEEIKERINVNNFGLEGNEDQFGINIEVIYTQLISKGQEWWQF